MKERPILFSGEMIRAILDGRKTQTRRVIDPQPYCPKAQIKYNKPGDWIIVPYYFNPIDMPSPPRFYNRRVKVIAEIGDRLWVRETWCCKMEDGEFVYNSNGEHEVYYASTENEHIIRDDGNGGTVYRTDGSEASPWQPSIHMPRWASRITLEVLNLRAERLQQISFEDCIAEGIRMPLAGDTDGAYAFAVSSYLTLWDSVNGKKHPWSSNPWVWVITFKRVNE